MIMRVNIYTLLAASLTFCSVAASAQNLDPTVEVNRSYEGKLMEVHKPMLEMAVPDSVLRFDLDFDMRSLTILTRERMNSSRIPWSFSLWEKQPSRRDSI